MKFKTKEDLINEAFGKRYNASMAINLAFNSFTKRVEFYKRYFNGVYSIEGYELFKKEQPKTYKEWINYLKETKLCACIYNNWLFTYCFGDIEK